MRFSAFLSRFAGAVAIFSFAASAVVEAAPADVAQIKSRQDKLRDMGDSLKTIDDELKKRTVDWENVIQPNARNLQERSPFLLKWFPKGTGPEAGAKTYALPSIWQKNEDFVKSAKAAMAEADKLSQTAAKKDVAAMKAQVFAMGKACKACHDDYRSKDYEKDSEE